MPALPDRGEAEGPIPALGDARLGGKAADLERAFPW